MSPARRVTDNVGITQQYGRLLARCHAGGTEDHQEPVEEGHKGASSTALGCWRQEPSITATALGR
jgi:endonuclease YncB( thermonuclease family)